MTDIYKLREFVAAMTTLADRNSGNDDAMIEGARPLLATLISNDEWLPEEFAKEGQTYRQYLLHCDPHQRFCVVSFVWGPGQTTPIHDHTVWGLIGMLRGAERGRRFEFSDGNLIEGEEELLHMGDIDIVSPTRGDIHLVSNAFTDRTSVSIHVYGANIGAVRRHVFNPLDGAATALISGYSNATIPNLWDLSDS